MNVAQSVRLDKEKRPEDFCPKCLWNVARSGACHKHMKPIECLYCFRLIAYGERSVSVNKLVDFRVHSGDCERFYKEDRKQDAAENDAADFIDEPLVAHHKRVPEPDRTGNVENPDDLYDEDQEATSPPRRRVRNIRNAQERYWSGDDA